VDGDAEVAVVRDGGFAGVQAHPHAQVAAVRPAVFGQGPLSGGCGEHGVPCAWKRDEQRVSLRVDLVPAALLEGGAQEPHVVGEPAGVAVAELTGQPRRALGVREENVTVPAGSVIGEGTYPPARVATPAERRVTNGPEQGTRAAPGRRTPPPAG
jgi:hypothetical protein